MFARGCRVFDVSPAAEVYRQTGEKFRSRNSSDDYRDRDERQFLYGLRRRVEGVKERALIGADNPVVRGDVKRGGEETRRDETGWDEMDEGRGEERTRAAERKREKGGRERESDGNKTWKNKTGRTTLMRATG